MINQCPEPTEAQDDVAYREAGGEKILTLREKKLMTLMQYTADPVDPFEDFTTEELLTCASQFLTKLPQEWFAGAAKKYIDLANARLKNGEVAHHRYLGAIIRIGPTVKHKL